MVRWRRFNDSTGLGSCIELGKGVSSTCFNGLWKVQPVKDLFLILPHMYLYCFTCMCFVEKKRGARSSEVKGTVCCVLFVTREKRKKTSVVCV